eukprot:m.149219 g.149219  ORF g.149219 m.149219 type:complete len:872 (-) comp30645_c1_seq1:469-3084(-)
MAAIQRVSDRLDATRSDLLSEFVSTTQKHFVWISELNEALQSQNAKQESRSVMLPKTPSANKRRPKRKPLGVVNDGNTKAKRGGSASKQFAAPKMTVLADVEENKPAQPMTRQLRKRTVSILHKRPVTPDVPTEEPTSKKSKTTPTAVKQTTEDDDDCATPIPTKTKKTKTSSKGKKKTPSPLAAKDAATFATPMQHSSKNTRQSIRRSVRQSVTQQRTGMVGAAIAALNAVAQTPVTAKKATRTHTPETVVKKARIETPETVVKATRAQTPDTVVKPTTTNNTAISVSANTPETTTIDNTIDAINANTPDTIVKSKRCKTPVTVVTKPTRGYHTPTTIGKPNNIVDVQKTPAGRFAAAMAFASSPKSSPSSAIKTKAPTRTIAKNPNLDTNNTSPTTSTSTQRITRQSIALMPTPSRVSRLVQKMQHTPVALTQHTPVRKRKSDALSDDGADDNIEHNVDVTSSSPTSSSSDPSSSYMRAKKDVLSVTRQNKKRMPSRSNVTRTPLRSAMRTNTTHEPDDRDDSADMEDNTSNNDDDETARSQIKSSARASTDGKVRKIAKGMMSFIPAKKVPVPVKRVIQVPALQKAKKHREEAAQAAKLLQKQKKEKAAAIAKKREEADLIRKQKVQDEIQKKADAQKERLALERERRANEEQQRKAKLERKQELAEQRKRDIAAQRAKLEEETKQRKEEIRAREAQILEKKAATAKKLEETRAIYEEKKKKEALRLREMREQREQERKQQEEEEARLREDRMRQQAQEATRLAQESQAHCASPMESYDLTHLQSDASSDDEDDPRAEVPKWAQGAALKNALYNQFLFSPPESKVTSLFPSPGPPVLEEIFPKKKSKFKARTSSAYWSPNPKTGGIMR